MLSRIAPAARLPQLPAAPLQPRGCWLTTVVAAGRAVAREQLFSNDAAQEVPIDPIDRFQLDPFVSRIKTVRSALPAPHAPYIL